MKIFSMSNQIFLFINVKLSWAWFDQIELNRPNIVLAIDNRDGI